MAEPLNARTAKVSDAAAIAEIYNQGIEDRIATFDTEPRTAESIAAQLRGRAPTHPAIVVERSGRVTGFAWAGEYRPRRAYAGVAEFSVYVAREELGQGVGHRALNALISPPGGCHSYPVTLIAQMRRPAGRGALARKSECACLLARPAFGACACGRKAGSPCGLAGR